MYMSIQLHSLTNGGKMHKYVAFYSRVKRDFKIKTNKQMLNKTF